MGTAEDAQGGVHVQVADGVHDRLRGGVRLCLVKPEVEMMTGDGILSFEIDCKGLASEEGIENASIVDMLFTVQEDPVYSRECLVKVH